MDNKKGIKDYDGEAFEEDTGHTDYRRPIMVGAYELGTGAFPRGLRKVLFIVFISSLAISVAAAVVLLVIGKPSYMGIVFACFFAVMFVVTVTSIVTEAVIGNVKHVKDKQHER